MTDEEKKRTKTQIRLDLSDGEELMKYLKTRGNKRKLAEELGVDPQTITNWMNAKKFPRYCLPFLKNLRIIENLQK